MNTFLIFLIAILLALAIAGFMMVSNKNKKKEALEERLNSLSDFKPQKTLIKVGASNFIPKGVSIDPDSQKICLIIGDNLELIPFSEVMEVELVVDGITETKTSRGSQVAGIAMGAVLGGGVGAIIGGLSGKTTTSQKTKNVQLRLIINNLHYPTHDIDFIEMTNTGNTPPQLALKEAEQWNNIFKVVIFQGNNSN